MDENEWNLDWIWTRVEKIISKWVPVLLAMMYNFEYVCQEQVSSTDNEWWKNNVAV